MPDIASRVYNRKWKIDPIVRSLIDTDFYKLLMCQSAPVNLCCGCADIYIYASTLLRRRRAFEKIGDDGKVEMLVIYFRLLSHEISWYMGTNRDIQMSCKFLSCNSRATLKVTT